MADQGVLRKLLDAVTDDWLPAKVIADRAGTDRRAAGQQLAALARAGVVVAARLRRYEPLAYRLPPGNAFEVREVPPSLSSSQIDHMLHLFGEPETEPLKGIVETLRELRTELNKREDETR